MVRVDYSKERFCHHCSVKVALSVFRCPDCHQKVRTKPHNKHQTYAKVQKYLNYNKKGNRQEDFRVKMRKQRIQRYMQGMNPNIPVPEVE